MAYMTEHEVMLKSIADLDRVRGERNDAHEAIDDMIDVIGRQIIKIAYDNSDFVCGRCLSTAGALFGLMKKYAREEDADFVRSRWKEITRVNIEDWR